MTEFELKLEVPPGRRQEVALAFGNAPRKKLLASYFDTDDFALAQCKVVVRVRKEGSQWVQTAKASSGNSLERLEHNVALPRLPGGALPAVDLSRHAGTPLELRLRAALKLKPGAPYPALVPMYQTSVQRQALDIKSGRSRVEVVFDRGRVIAGDKQALLCELEFELKSGKPQDAVRLTRTWCTRHGLWLSTVSKSAKAQRLAQDLAPTAVLAHPVRLEQGTDIRNALAAMVLNCMDHVLPNMSDVASDVSGNSPGSEQIHQLRIGLRRLRTVLRELGDSQPGINAAWEPELARVFRVLGEHRDREFLTLHMQPQLIAAGGPAFDPAPAAVLPDPVQAVRSAAFQRTLLELLGFAHGQAASAGEPAVDVVRTRLVHLHRQIVRQGHNFLTLDEAHQHRLRKRLKRLRYLAELARPLFKGKQVDKYLHALKPVQDALGVYNDRRMAFDAYCKLAHDDPRAWFAIGWLGANRQDDAKACQRALRALAKGKIFW
ncbi:MAG: CYTH and CHAD domain-containing protein [Burkholderiaceae bacterium]|nr:CYTH and CHAD domain-containing protein [Burkholderiaceae bacterium]